MPGFQVTRKDDIEPFAEYFDRKVTIEKLVPTAADGQGGQAGSLQTPGNWQNIFPGTIWAHMEPWKGKEQFFAQQQYPTKLERVLIRYRKTVNIVAGMRLRYKSQTYRIRFVGVPAEARKVIELLCEELQSKGSVA